MSSQADPSGVSWRKLGIESVAVLVSILLAFAIDAWWDGYQESRRESQLLDGLAADFEASRAQLVDRLELAKRMTVGNGLLLDLLSAQAPGTTVMVPDSLIMSALTAPTYEPSTNALDAALASGEIDLVRNQSIRLHLATWRRTLADTAEDELEVRRITNEQVVPLLARSVGLAPYFAEVLEWSGGDPFGPGSAVTPVTESGLAGSSKVVATSELQGAVAARRFYAEFSAADQATLLALLDSALVLLRN